jgi:hypothetical protein
LTKFKKVSNLLILSLGFMEVLVKAEKRGKSIKTIGFLPAGNRWDITEHPALCLGERKPATRKRVRQRTGYKAVTTYGAIARSSKFPARPTPDKSFVHPARLCAA